MQQLDVMPAALAMTANRADWPAAGTRPTLTLVPPAPVRADQPATTPATNVVREAAAAKARHTILRLAQDFLDREGFVDTLATPSAELATMLGRVYWSSGSTKGLPTLTGMVTEGDGLSEMFDLFERLVASVLQGTISRARGELMTLGVDRDMLKYVRLPVRRIALEDALTLACVEGPELLVSHEDAVMSACGEPLFISFYDEPGAQSAWCRFLLPRVGCIGSASDSGRWTFDLERLARFVLETFTTSLARPGLERN